MDSPTRLKHANGENTARVVTRRTKKRAFHHWEPNHPSKMPEWCSLLEDVPESTSPEIQKVFDSSAVPAD